MSSSCRSPGPERAAPGAWRGRILAGVLGLVVLPGCELGPQSEPVIVSVPAQTGAPLPNPVATGVPLNVQVYLLKGASLYRVTRTVPPGPGLGPTLAGMSAELSPDERALGLRTALPPTPEPLDGIMTRGDTARIELPETFDRLPVQEQINALGQIVFTVTADTLATGVQLVRNGKPVAVPDASGQLQDRPVTREDYAALTPRSDS